MPVDTPDGMMTVDLGDGWRVFVPEGSDVEAVESKAKTWGSV
jgi:hypothetical protein